MPKYRAHLAPVWQALPEDDRGELVAIDDDQRPPGGEAALVASYIDMRAARRAGYQRIALMEHGIGQSYLGAADKHQRRDCHLPGGDDRDPVGLFLSPNAHAAKQDCDRYPGARVEVVGAPILDTLPRKPERSDPPVVAVTWHWHSTYVPEMRSAFEHFRDALAGLPQQLIGHAHPQAGNVPAFYKATGIEYEPSWRRVLERADVLIADNTSSMFEFAATGRPVVVLNDPHYRRNVDHGLRYWDAADVGVQVVRPDELAAAVDEALADGLDRVSARNAALDVVYAHREGGAARAASALLDWLQ